MIAPGRKRSASLAATGFMTSNCSLLRVSTTAPEDSLSMGVRVAVTTTVSAAGARRSWTVTAEDEAGASVVSAAKPCARTRTLKGPALLGRKTATPSAEVVFTPSTAVLPGSSNSTCAPATTADCGSTTLILSSAAEAADRKTNRERKPLTKRIHFSFARERGLVLRFAPVSWLTSKGGLRRPATTTGLPGGFPVTGCNFLAYSCAAARDFHPLPNSSSRRRGRANQIIVKERKKRFEEFTRTGVWKSTRRRELRGMKQKQIPRR